MDRWSRRRVLKAGAIAGATPLAGCAGGREGATRTETRRSRTDDTRTETDSPAESAAETDTRTETTTPPTVFETAAYTVETMARDLVVPWDLSFDPAGNCYFTERPGRLNVLTPDGRVRRLARLRGTVSENERECGLLGVALHPEFPDPPSIYVYQSYRASEGIRNRILRFEWSGSRLGRRRVVLDRIPGDWRHDGGRLSFGFDGYLYATTGDSTDGELAQERDSLAGKTLRIAPDGSVPADNPFSGSPVYSYGHRNPQGITHHPETGKVYATEHGPIGRDEVNHIRPGRNYGWPKATGETDDSEYAVPEFESGDSSWAPTGAAIYDASPFPDWQGDLLFTTLGYSPGEGRQSLLRASLDDGGDGPGPTEVVPPGRFGRLRAVEVAPDGSVYLATSNRDGHGEPVRTDDRLLRLRPTDG